MGSQPYYQLACGLENVTESASWFPNVDMRVKCKMDVKAAQPEQGGLLLLGSPTQQELNVSAAPSSDRSHPRGGGGVGWAPLLRPHSWRRRRHPQHREGAGMKMGQKFLYCASCPGVPSPTQHLHKLKTVTSALRALNLIFGGGQPRGPGQERPPLPEHICTQKVRTGCCGGRSALGQTPPSENRQVKRGASCPNTLSAQPPLFLLARRG